MSNEEGRLAALLLRESFGEVVEEVGNYLFKNGPCSLLELKKNLTLQTLQIKKSLCVLIQHQLVAHRLFKAKTRLYELQLRNVLHRLEFSRCVHASKNLHGDAGEFIIEDILQLGHAPMSECVERVSERLRSCGIKEEVGDIIRQQFEQLVKDQFLSRVESETPGAELPSLPNTEDKEKPETKETKGKGKKRKQEDVDKGSEPKAKKKKGEEEGSWDGTAGGGEDHWQVNHSWFQCHFRDQAIVGAVASQLGETAANVMKILLKMSNTSELNAERGKELPSILIFSSLPAKPRLTAVELDQYLKVLVEQSGFLTKTDESGGGMYAVNFKRCSEVLCRSTLECVVRERYGSKALRVFRLLLLKRLLDQKQVEESAMLSSKEAREILYTLMADNFVSLQEIPKTADYAPSRTFYLFSVALLPVAVMVRERCLKAMSNLITRRVTEARDNRRLLERYQLQEKQISKEVAMDMEPDDILTPDEKRQAEDVKKGIARLEHAEVQLSETLNVLTMYSQTHMNPVSSAK